MKVALSQIKIAGLMLSMAGLLMGNEGCEGTKARQLKMEVEMGAISAQPIRLPNNEVVDFPLVVNALFLSQTLSSDRFVPYTPTGDSSPVTKLGVQGKTTKSVPAQFRGHREGDLAILEKYGFIAAARAKSSSGVAMKAGVADSDVPACYYQRPMARLSGAVIGFAVEGGGGINIGYGSGGALPGGIGGKVDFQSTRMEMNVSWMDAMTRQYTASANGVAHQTNVSFGITFGVGLPIGLDFFYKTPLADAIRASLDRALDSIGNSYVTNTARGKTWNDAWEGRVAYDPVISDNDTLISFKGGSNFGMVEGDTMTVANMHYAWDGAPCTSNLKYRIPLSNPIAEVKIVRTGHSIAVAQVTKYYKEERIAPGAQLKLLKLFDPAAEKKQAAR